MSFQNHKKDISSSKPPDEEITLETLESEDASSFHTKDVKALRESLKQCQKEKQEYLDGWQRAKADFVNFKRDVEEMKKHDRAFATESLIFELLAVLDSFEMAFSNKDAWEKADPEWRRGVEYIHTQLLKILATHHLDPIEPTIGTPFDPTLHLAVRTVPTDNETKDQTIDSILQRGYLLHGKVIRPARVEIAEFQGKE